MTGMQHTVDKGIYFSLLDSRYSGSVEERNDILTKMRAAADPNNPQPNVFRDTGTLGQKFASGTTIQEANSRLSHLYRHWFGYVDALSADDADESAAVPDAIALTDWVPRPEGPGWSEKSTTGWWARWRGDAFNIFRITLIRAIEVSLGLDIDGDVPINAFGELEPARHWPIDFHWICGAPKFEGWISWRDLGDQGAVHVLMVTPSIGDDPGPGLSAGISLSLTAGHGTVAPPPGPARDYEVVDQPGAPARPTLGQAHGLWVVGHDLSHVDLTPGSFPCEANPNDDWLVDWGEREQGAVVAPTSLEVVTVQPAEVDGGVRRSGRNWR